MNGHLKIKHWHLALMIFFSALFLMSFNISYPETLNFDESHYIPAAREIIKGDNHTNKEHPVLAKYIIASGISLFGDHSTGWRAMSVIFGSLSLVGMFYIGCTLFGTLNAGLLCVILTFLNQVHLVQSRIAMLDTFMVSFLVFAILFYIRFFAKTSTLRFRELTLSSMCFGGAIACKWFALVPYLSCVFLLALLWVFRNKDKLINALVDDQNMEWSIDFFKNSSVWKLMLFSIVPAIVIYYLSHLPLLFLKNPNYSLLDILMLPIETYQLQLNVGKEHVYQSPWWKWPLLLRPIWYAWIDPISFPEGIGGYKVFSPLMWFKKYTPETDYVRAVLNQGNPVMMIGGFFLFFRLLYDWLKSKKVNSFLICFFYAQFVFSWILIPRNVSFFYYYYPAAMILPLVWSFYLLEKDHRRILSRRFLKISLMASMVLMFLFFYPVLASVPFPRDLLPSFLWCRALGLSVCNWL